MNTEDLLRMHAELHPDGDWIGYSDFYQEMLERYGQKLWGAIPHLLAEPSHDARCCALILAGTRRPESTEAMLLISPFMRDPHPLVRLTAFYQLLSFSWVERSVEELAFVIQQEEHMAKDQVPCVMAIWLLLKANRAAYQGEMIPKLELIHDLEFGESMVTDVVEQVFREFRQR